MNTQDFSEIIQLFSSASMLPVTLFSEKQILASWGSRLQDFNLPLLIRNSLPSSLPDRFYLSSPEQICAAGLRISQDHLLLIGPTLNIGCSSRQADLICRRIGRRQEDASAIRLYFSRIGIHTVPCLLSNLSVVCRLLGLRSPDGDEVPAVPFQWDLPYTSAYDPDFIRREQKDLGDDIERTLISCIRSGDTEGLNHILQMAFPSETLHPFADAKDVRNYLIGANVLVSRIALTAGVSYQSIAEISGKYIERIVNSSERSDLDLLFVEILNAYTEMIRQLRDIPSDSPVVRFIHQYITDHYDRKVTPALLAEKLHMNVSYLCTLFRKETGMTITAYVRREKINEAKRLLKGSRYTVAQISDALAFSSQSYFGSIFRKETGMTPEEYRKKPIP